MKSNNKKCSLQVFDGQKTLYGTAAQLKYISANGGWDAYHYDLISDITNKVYKEIMVNQNKPKLHIAK